MPALKNFTVPFLLSLLILASIPMAYSHPGRTDASECHTCRTNCEKWGLKYGEYHCHKKTAETSQPAPIISSPELKPQAEATSEKINDTLVLPSEQIIQQSEQAPPEKPEKEAGTEGKQKEIPTNPTEKIPAERPEIRPKAGEEPTKGENLPPQPTPETTNLPSVQNEEQKQENISQEKPPKSSVISRFNESFFKVAEITDGDTIKVSINGTIETVRLLGIDSPETYKKKQCFGAEATLGITALVRGKAVRLEPDSKQPNRDKYGRLLRYVYLDDGTSVNGEMVKRGYAVAYRKYNSDKLKLFVDIERSAEKQQIGLWGKCPIITRFLYKTLQSD